MRSRLSAVGGVNSQKFVSDGRTRCQTCAEKPAGALAGSDWRETLLSTARPVPYPAEYQLVNDWDIAMRALGVWLGVPLLNPDATPYQNPLPDSSIARPLNQAGRWLPRRHREPAQRTTCSSSCFRARNGGFVFASTGSGGWATNPFDTSITASVAV